MHGRLLQYVRRAKSITRCSVAAAVAILIASAGSVSGADPLLPDLIAWEKSTSPFYMRDGIMDTATIPNKVLYRFSQPIPNIGEGPLELREVTHPNQTQDIYQRVHDSEAGVTERFVGSFPDADPPYSHLWLVGIAEYRLRTVTPGNGVGDIVRMGVKTSYGLFDSVQYNTSLPGSPPGPVYVGADEYLGISVGYADVYTRTLSGQWIDVTGIPDGQYWLETEVDPYGLIEEIDDTNNTTRVLVNLVVPEPTILPGDYNQDDVVNSLDYVLWRISLGQEVARGTGADGNGNGEIDPADYAEWAKQYGSSRPGSGAGASVAVPEPSSIGLLSLVALVFLPMPRAERRSNRI